MKPGKNCRADILIFNKGLAASRTEAQALILAGQVYGAHGRIEKPGQFVAESDEVRVEKRLPFVSRGGIKLAGALDDFKVDPSMKICLDVGASTGGFTDCLLQRGAKKVYAIDVGYGQFHWKLRQDPRIVLFEKTNFRYMDTTRIPEPIALAAIDVSFISLTKILPKVWDCLADSAEAVALVKPQFELSPGEVSKGVVRSEALREKAISKIEAEAKKIGFKMRDRSFSVIRGPKGNQECFLHLLRSS